MPKRGPKPKAKPNPPPDAWVGFTLPDDAQDDVREAFARLKSRLESVGTLGSTDPLLVLMAARAAALMDRAMRSIDRDGETIPTNNGMSMQHPGNAVLTTQSKLLRGLLSDMGLTPGSAKLGDARPDESANPWVGLATGT